MPSLLEVKTMTDPRGSLSVLDTSVLPFDVKRVFYISGVPAGETRGAHRHKVTRMVLFCAAGSCVINCDNGKQKQSFNLKAHGPALLIEPEDYHTMTDFTEACVLTVLASHEYDKNDYIHEAY